MSRTKLSSLTIRLALVTRKRSSRSAVDRARSLEAARRGMWIRPEERRRHDGDDLEAAPRDELSRHRGVDVAREEHDATDLMLLDVLQELDALFRKTRPPVFDA